MQHWAALVCLLEGKWGFNFCIGSFIWGLLLGDYVFHSYYCGRICISESLLFLFAILVFLHPHFYTSHLLHFSSQAKNLHVYTVKCIWEDWSGYSSLDVITMNYLLLIVRNGRLLKILNRILNLFINWLFILNMLCKFNNHCSGQDLEVDPMSCHCSKIY